MKFFSSPCWITAMLLLSMPSFADPDVVDEGSGTNPYFLHFSHNEDGDLQVTLYTDTSILKSGQLQKVIQFFSNNDTAEVLVLPLSERNLDHDVQIEADPDPDGILKIRGEVFDAD